jgi:hypothetical protein
MKVDYVKNIGWEVSLKKMKIGPFSDVTDPDLKNIYFLIEDFSDTVHNEKDIIGCIGALGVLASIEKREEKRELVLADRVDRFYKNKFKTSYEAGRSIISLTVKKYTEKYTTVEEIDKNFKNIVSDVSERVTKQYPVHERYGVGKSFIERVVQIKVIEEMSRRSNPDPSTVS